MKEARSMVNLNATSKKIAKKKRIEGNCIRDIVTTAKQKQIRMNAFHGTENLLEK